MALTALAIPLQTQATPAFTRQTGMACAQCHTDFPALTETGRKFKLEGYTNTDGSTEWPPLSAMIQAGFTHTKKGIDGGAAEHFGDNDNLALAQASLF